MMSRKTRMEDSCDINVALECKFQNAPWAVGSKTLHPCEDRLNLGQVFERNLLMVPFGYLVSNTQGLMIVNMSVIMPVAANFPRRSS